MISNIIDSFELNKVKINSKDIEWETDKKMFKNMPDWKNK
jgi:hypothetical protein